MKKNIYIFTLLLSAIFQMTFTKENNSLVSTNKPKILTPLPNEAYQSVYSSFKDIFLASDQDFMMFLQNRYQRNKEDKHVEAESVLINTFARNYIKDLDLKSKSLPMSAFAVSTEALYYHQLIADTRLYPQNYLLTDFEQNYDFKLHPIKSENFSLFISLLPAAQIVLYKQTTIRNLAKFLLIALSKR